jgi:hypothetical protein
MPDRYSPILDAIGANSPTATPEKPAGPAPMMRLVRDSIVSPSGLSFDEGAYGTAINGQPFQQEAVTTFKGFQYAAYYDARGRTAVARRALPDGDWQCVVFEDYGPITHTDIHNVIVLGICPLDGTIHLAYDHHCDELHYRRSRTGAASEPQSHEWTADLFGETTSQLVTGRTIPGVTYPQFFTAPNGHLQLALRIGCSGDGDWDLYEYAPEGWSRIGSLFTRNGTFLGRFSRCAYPNSFRYGPEGRLHCTWVWREEGTDINGNHDLCYIHSDNHGRTWKNNDGKIVGRLNGQSRSNGAVGVASPGIVVHPIPYDWGCMNTSTQAIDPKGRVHVVMWRNPSDAKAGSLDLNDFRYYHYWRENDGTWHEQLLPFYGRKPQIVLDDASNLIVVFGRSEERNYHDSDPGSHLTLAAASCASGWTDWRLTERISSARFIGEPLVDYIRWEKERVLSVYFQEMPAIAGDDAPLHVLDFVA